MISMTASLKNLRSSALVRRPDSEAILAALALPVIALDRAGTIVYANAAADWPIRAKIGLSAGICSTSG